MSTEITFCNATALSVDVFWINFEGEETRYASLGPYGLYTQSTYEGHRWLVRDAASGEKLAETAAQAEPRRFVIGSDVVTARTGSEVAIVFHNASPVAAGVYWVDGEGKETLYASLRPGETYRQSSFAGHVWRIRSLHCGTEIGFHIASDAAEQACEIALKTYRSEHAVSATFTNRSALHIEAVWLDLEGAPVVYHRLAPGETVTQPTFSSHPWLLRDLVSGTPIRVIPNLFEAGEIVENAAALRSLQGTMPSRTVLRNLCTQTGRLFWVGFDGVEKDYATLDPGAEVTLDTFAGHPWRLRDLADGGELSLLIASAETGRLRSFEPQPREGRAVATLTVANRALLTLDVGVAGEDGVFHPLHRLPHGSEVALRVGEGREIELRDAISGLVIRRIRGADTDLAAEIRPLDVRSQPETAEVTVEMRNETPFDIDILWLDFDGNEKHYARLGPGETYLQPTLQHHVWRARERFGRHLVGIYAASPERSQSMAFTMRSLESRRPTGIRFANRTLLTADVYWMDYEGRPKLYASLRPGASTGFRTYATHPWILRDRLSGRVLDWSWGDREDALITLDDTDLRPREGEVAANVTFANKLAWTVDLFWIGYDGKETCYATLAPGESVAIDTFETHPWRVRQAHSGDKIAMFITTSEPRQHHDIVLKSEASEVETRIEFANTSPLTLDVYWVDYQGREKKYATLEPRTSHSQQTFMTHPWIVRDQRSGEPVGFTVGLRQEQRLMLTGVPTRSRDGGRKVERTLANGSGLRADVFWIDHAGREQSFGTLEPGASLDVTTYAAHAWRLRESEGGAEIDLYIASAEARQSYRIRNALVRTRERANAELWPGEVAFYEEPEFKGRVWILHADTPDCTRIAGMNDRVSSIRVGPDTATMICRDVRYGGTNDVIYMDTPSLADGDVGLNAISSATILSTPPLAACRFSATSRLTEDMAVTGGEVVRSPVLRTMLTLPPLSGAVDVWATEELRIRANGQSHLIDPVRPARLSVNEIGKLEILVDPEAIGGGALMLRTPAMAPRERVFVFPDADLHSKILAMEDDALWRDRTRLGLSASLTEADAVHAGRALKSLSSTVPAAHRALSHGTSADRFTIADAMSYDRWKLELGGAGKTLFRPAGREEIAAASAGAIRVNEMAGQGFLDFLEDGASAVGGFFVETIPKAARTVAKETEEFIVEDVPGALEDAGRTVVRTVTPIGREIAETATKVWDDSVGWVERTADDVVEGVVDGVNAVKRSAKQFASDIKDAYDELDKDVLKGLAMAAKAVLRVTMDIGGVVYQFIADTIEVVGKVFCKVLDGIGIGLGKLVRVFMDLFDTDGVLELHDALIDKINGGIDLAEGAVRTMKGMTATWLGDLQSQILEGFDSAIDQLGGGDIARIDRDQPQDRSEAIDKLDWLMSKLTGSGDDGGGEAPEANPFLKGIAGAAPAGAMSKFGSVIEPLIEKLEAFVESDFGIVLDAFGDSIALFRAALANPSRAPELVLSGVLSLAKGLAVTGISLIEAIADLLFDAFIAALELLKTALNTRLEIPFLTAFYESMTGRELSAISLVAFLVAVPASIIGRITLGRQIRLRSQTAALSLSKEEKEVREEKQAWAVVYGSCHLCLNGFDLFYDISGAKIQKAPADNKAFEMHEIPSKVNTGGGEWAIAGEVVEMVPVATPVPASHYLNPPAGSQAGKGMALAKLGVIVVGSLAQVAGNPTGAVSGLKSSEIGNGLRGLAPDGSRLPPLEAERARYGSIIWTYQWLYVAMGVVDFGFSASEAFGGKGGGKATEYGLPIATTLIGIVHMGLMSKFVNTDQHAEEWSASGSKFTTRVLERRRYGWLMDTFPAVTKVLALNELNRGTLYIPLAIHASLFVTYGHIGEASSYFARSRVPVDDAAFDL